MIFFTRHFVITTIFYGESRVSSLSVGDEAIGATSEGPRPLIASTLVWSPPIVWTKFLNPSNKCNAMSSSTTLLGGLPETEPHRHRCGGLLGGEGDCPCFRAILSPNFLTLRIVLATCSPQWLLLTKASSSALVRARLENYRVKITYIKRKQQYLSEET